MSKILQSTNNLVDEMNNFPPNFFNTNLVGKKLYRGFILLVLSSVYAAGYVRGTIEELVKK